MTTFFCGATAANNLYGIEINDSIARVAKMNMIIHDDGHTNVICYDALSVLEEISETHKHFVKDKFDLIITNPPFGAQVKKSKSPYITEYILGKKSGKVRESQSTEILFVERCLNFLKPGSGKIAIVLPDSITVNSSNQYVRDFILQNFQLLAVFSLPDFTFSSFGANVKSSILYMRKKAEDETSAPYDIFMANIRKIGYTASGKHDSKNDLHVVLKAFKNFSEKGIIDVPEEYKNEIYCENSSTVIQNGRLDPNAYSPIFRNVKEMIQKTKEKNNAEIYSLGELVTNPISGEWGEDPETFDRGGQGFSTRKWGKLR
jgi:type I restriction enzyme M protein